ncbi:MAG: InlB B-repeat-containing protein, partial [Clostridia bacterium]|nr:InlB B-repeat-containing protein [Clostridia bacterium]
TPKSITEDMITLSPDTAEYNGGDITPVVTVNDGEKTLEKGTDYTVSYNNNVNASENAKVIVKGIGNYTGIVERTFTITPASVTLTAGSAEETYDGTEKTVSGFTSSVSGLTFDGVSASGNGTLAGSYDVTFSGVTVNETKDTSGNYAVTETVNGTLTINPVTDEVTVTITGNSDTADYDGEEKSVSGYDVSISNPLYTESDFTFSGTAEAKRTEPGTENMGLDESQFSNSSSDFANVKFVIAEDGKLTVNPVITFVNEDGTELQSGAVALGETPEYKGETPVKTENDGYAYEFAAWSPEITEATENATYTATYTQTANVYTATFIADGETVDTVHFTVEDSTITEPAVPEKEGNTGEWEEYTLGAEDITVNAVYTLNDYNIIYVIDGNETEVTYKYGAAVEKPADPVKDGFDFIGWDEEIPDTMPAENLTVTALFEAIPEPEEPTPTEPTPTEPTPTDTEPAHEHSYKGEVTTKPTCTEDGIMTYTCECGESYTKAIPKTGHKPGEWTVITPATTEAAGKEVKKCEVCGETIAEREIAKLEPQETDAGIVSVNLEKTNAFGIANAFGVDPEKLPAGSTVTWYVNGEKAGEGNGFRV